MLTSQAYSPVKEAYAPKWLCPDGETVLLDSALVFQGGQIIALGPRDNILGGEHSDAFLRLDDREASTQHLLIPGLINCHAHSALALFRGAHDGGPLERWLSGLFRAEARAMCEEYVFLGTRLAGREYLESGCTCVNEMYYHDEAARRAFEGAGLRSFTGVAAAAVPYMPPAAQQLAAAAEKVARPPAHPLSRAAFCPHSLYTLPPAAVVAQWHGIYGDENAPPVRWHMHLNETAAEREAFLNRCGEPAVAWLDRRGALGPHLVAVHMVHLEPGEIDALARRGASVVHCPRSNMKLGSGVCPVRALLAAGVNVALGTDSACSNNSLSLLDEMQAAAMLQALTAAFQTPTATPAAAEQAAAPMAAAGAVAPETSTAEPSATTVPPATEQLAAEPLAAEPTGAAAPLAAPAAQPETLSAVRLTALTEALERIEIAEERAPAYETRTGSSRPTVAAGQNPLAGQLPFAAAAASEEGQRRKGPDEARGATLEPCSNDRPGTHVTPSPNRQSVRNCQAEDLRQEVPVIRHSDRQLRPSTYLKMATINGARALGVDDLIGSLRPGKAADFAVLEMEDPGIPIIDVLSDLVFRTRRKAVTVVVAGRTVVERGKCTTVQFSAAEKKRLAYYSGLASEKMDPEIGK